MNRVKRGDEVVVVAGKSKGMRGLVKEVFFDKNRVLVEGVNMIKKHVKPNPQKGIQGGIVEREASLHISNVGLYNSESGKPGKIGYKVLEDGKKVRYFKSNGEVLDI